MNLSDYTAPPRKLKVGGGQDEGDAAAARASCLPPCHGGFFFVFPLKTVWQLSDCGAFATREGPCQLGGLVPLGCWWVYVCQCTACRVLYHLTGTATVFLSEL